MGDHTKRNLALVIGGAILVVIVTVIIYHMTRGSDDTKEWIHRDSVYCGTSVSPSSFTESNAASEEYFIDKCKDATLNPYVGAGPYGYSCFNIKLDQSPAGKYICNIMTDGCPSDSCKPTQEYINYQYK